MLAIQKRPLYRNYSHWSVIGDTIVLSQTYDADQFWFDFCKGIVCRTASQGNSKEDFNNYADTTYYDRTHVKQLADGPFGWRGDNRSIPHLVPPTLNVAQFDIPFEEYRCIKGLILDHYEDADFPSFDRDPEGKLFKIEGYFRKTKDSVIEWCLSNMSGRFGVSNSYIIVEHAEDALLARMRF